MYANGTSAVKIDGSLTDEFKIQAGVKQGDNLSPLLFNLFINDIIDQFNTTDCSPPSLIESKVGSLLYADDLVIMSTSIEGLQISMQKLHNYCTKWKLNVNMPKTKVM